MRELLNYPGIVFLSPFLTIKDGSQNKANVLQAAVDNIKRLKDMVANLMNEQKKSSEQMMKLLGENERLRTLINEKGGNAQPMTSSMPNGISLNSIHVRNSTYSKLNNVKSNVTNMNLPNRTNFTSLGNLNIHSINAMGKSVSYLYTLY